MPPLHPVDSFVCMLDPQGVALCRGEWRYLEAWPWRKCVAAGAGFEVSDVQARSSMAHLLFLLSVNPDIELGSFSSTMSVCLPPCFLHHDSEGPNL